MPIRSAIRHLATSRSGNILLAAEFEQKVYVWDVDTGNQILYFGTILDFGGSRLALSEQKNVCIAGSYRKKSVASYSLIDGSSIWEHKVKKGVQMIRISPCESKTYCCLDEGPCQVFDTNTGELLEKINGVRDVAFDPYNNRTLFIKKKLELHDGQGKNIQQISRETFAVLDIAFGPHHIAISESTGNVRFFPVDDLSKNTVYKPPEKHHVLKLSYSENTNNFLGVQWAYETGGNPSLIKLNALSGEAEEVTTLIDAGKTVFCKLGTYLITSAGNMVQTTSGSIDKTLKFPQRT